MKISTSGQTLAFFSERLGTFYCGSCNRDILLRARYHHPSTKCHLAALNGTRPTRRAYVKKVRSERSRSSAYIAQGDLDYDALEAYYRQCAIEDGTVKKHKEWLAS